MHIPLLGFLFSRTEETVDDVDFVVVITARQMDSIEEDIAETVRRRMAFERSIARVADLGSVGDAPYAVLLDTVRSADQAREIAEAFEGDGFETRVTDWDAAGSSVHDVYVVDLASFDDAVVLARKLNDAGWPAELTVLQPENEMAEE
jgi:type II secretory pathway component GspD/PulD (secretin)